MSPESDRLVDNSRKHYIRRRQNTSAKIINRSTKTMTCTVENTTSNLKQRLIVETVFMLLLDICSNPRSEMSDKEY